MTHLYIAFHFDSYGSSFLPIINECNLFLLLDDFLLCGKGLSVQFNILIRLSPNQNFQWIMDCKVDGEMPPIQLELVLQILGITVISLITMMPKIWNTNSIGMGASPHLVCSSNTWTSSLHTWTYMETFLLIMSKIVFYSILQKNKIIKHAIVYAQYLVLGGGLLEISKPIIVIWLFLVIHHFNLII
jgi:hypothetical protein